MHFYIYLILSYILGSVPFGKIIGYVIGVNIQKEGSGNIGFANSLRIMGWKPAIFVLLGDFLKGYFPVYYALNHFSLNYTLVVSLVVIVGSIFSCFLKFKGGKGVATMIGITLALNLIMFFIAILVWIIIFFLYRISSVSSLLIVTLLPLISLLIDPKLFYLYSLLCIIIFITHRKNILNLIKGKEIKTL